jgi:hypothetical protein
LLFGQEGSNRIYIENKIALIFTESLWNNDTLIVAGSFIDSMWNSESGLYFLNSQGEIVLSNENIGTSNEFSYQYFSKGLTILNDTIYQLGYKTKYSDTTANDEILYGVFQKFTTKGVKISESEIKGKYFPSEHWARPNDFILHDNKITATYITWMFEGEDQNSQICIIQLYKNGLLVFDECYGNDSRETSNTILRTENEDFLIIGDSHNFYISDFYQGSGNGFWHGYIFRVDSLGKIKWEWRSPNNYESANSAILENDSTIVVAAGYGVEECEIPGNPLSWCSIIWNGDVYKMDLNSQTKIWERSMSIGTYTSKPDNQYFDIISSIEKDGYILCGSAYDLAYPGCQQIDTQKCWSYPGVISKVSINGDSIWQRKYFGVRDLWESNRLLDIEIVNDSSYSFVGEAYNPFAGETQGQHGWVLNTDKFGCIIPGCHLISSIEPDLHPEIFESIMRIYPNPPIDVLNVLITTKISSTCKVKLIDNLGREVNSWSDFETGATYQLPMSDLSPGLYYLTLVDKNQIIETQKIVISF